MHFRINFFEVDAILEKLVMDEFEQRLSQRLNEVEDRLALLERNQELAANATRRAAIRRLWLRPPMGTFEQHPPRALDLRTFPPSPSLPAAVPRIPIATPSYNHCRYLYATIDNPLSQNYPHLHYPIQPASPL